MPRRRSRSGFTSLMSLLSLRPSPAPCPVLILARTSNQPPRPPPSAGQRSTFRPTTTTSGHPSPLRLPRVPAGIVISGPSAPPSPALGRPTALPHCLTCGKVSSKKAVVALAERRRHQHRHILALQLARLVPAGVQACGMLHVACECVLVVVMLQQRFVGWVRADQGERGEGGHRGRTRNTVQECCHTTVPSHCHFSYHY